MGLQVRPASPTARKIDAAIRLGYRRALEAGEHRRTARSRQAGARELLRWLADAAGRPRRRPAATCSRCTTRAPTCAPRFPTSRGEDGPRLVAWARDDRPRGDPAPARPGRDAARRRPHRRAGPLGREHRRLLRLGARRRRGGAPGVARAGGRRHARRRSRTSSPAHSLQDDSLDRATASRRRGATRSTSSASTPTRCPPSPTTPARASSPAATRSACGGGRCRPSRSAGCRPSGTSTRCGRARATSPTRSRGSRPCRSSTSPSRSLIDDPPPADRATLGLPEGFLFLFSFDYESVFERKNPLAIVEAFTRAFEPGVGRVARHQVDQPRPRRGQPRAAGRRRRAAPRRPPHRPLRLARRARPAHGGVRLLRVAASLGGVRLHGRGGDGPRAAGDRHRLLGRRWTS